jgi:hypothetical protein
MLKVSQRRRAGRILDRMVDQATKDEAASEAEYLA